MINTEDRMNEKSDKTEYLKNMNYDKMEHKIKEKTIDIPNEKNIIYIKEVTAGKN